MITRFARLTNRLSIALVLLFGIAACGGGGGGGGGGFLPDDGGSSKTFTLELTLNDVNGNVINNVTSTAPVTLTVFLSSGQTPVADAVVAAVADIGVLLPESGTALTDQDGMALFQIEAGDVLGAGSVQVTFEGENEGDEAVTESLNFQVGQASLRIGHFDGSVFVDGEIGINPDSLPAGGSTLLNLAVVDDEGIEVDTAEEIKLRSDCALNGLAELPSTVTTVNGRASVAYTAKGCEGSDSLTATLVEGTGQAVGTIAIASPSAGSINSISASPGLLALKGTGGPGRQETSEVVFQVVTGTGAPIAGVNVQFSLSTDVGGVKLNNLSTLSDNEGLATTHVASGDVATPVRVIATVQVDDGSGSTLTISTVSDILVISTGLPDQNSISLSSSLLNVAGAMDLDGLTSLLTVRMADKFNNPVPDGTAAVFTTEYGSIVDSCVTSGGSCSVTWTSQSPRRSAFNDSLRRTIAADQTATTVTPCPSPLVDGPGPCPVDLGAIRGGRSTILVTAIGEESFVDANANGKYDEGEAFINLPEAFIDHNEDGLFTPLFNPSDLSGEEETLVDFNRNGVYDLNDQPELYNGILCPQEGAGVWCSRDLLNVRDSLTLVMSHEEMTVILVNSSGTQVNGTTAGPIYTIYIADINNNPPAADAVISVKAQNGCELVNDPVTSPPDTNKSGAFGIEIETTGDGEEAGSITVSVKNGGGSTSETFSCSWPVEEPLDCDFSPKPPECP